MLDSPLHKGRRRAQMMEVINRHMWSLPELQTDSSDQFDYVHPLHILHQIAPSWSAWRLHSAVLNVLAGVLHGLESGLEIRPVKSREELLEDSDDPIRRAEQQDSYEKRRQGQLRTAEILRRLYEGYPRALMTVETWERNQYDHERNPDFSEKSSNLQ